MAVDQTANFVRINVDGTHTDTDTTIQLESGEASELPDPANGEYNLTWWDDTFADHPSDDDNVEIVRVTGVDTGNDTITVQRGREDTTAVAHDNSQAQYRMVLSATAGLFDQFEDVTNLDGSSGSAEQFLKTDGTNLEFADVPDEVVIQDTEPTNPFEGMWWYDVDNSAMQYYNGTDFVTPGNPIDGSSITESAQGEIQVSKPSNILIESFEGSQGIFSYDTGTDGDVWSVSSTRSIKGNDSIYYSNPNGYHLSAVETIIDVTNASSITIFGYAQGNLQDGNYGMRLTDEEDTSSRMGYGEYLTEARIPYTGKWFKLELDVSEYSGNKRVVLSGRTDSNGGGELWFDSFRKIYGIRKGEQ